MFKSLKSKIVAAMVLLVSICVLAFTTISIYEIRTTVTNQMKNDGASLAAVISREVGKYILTDTEDVEVILKEIKEQSNENIKYISFMDTNSNIIASSEGSASGKDKGNNIDTDSSATVAVDESVEVSIQGRESSGYIFETSNGDRVYNVSTPFYKDNKLVGTIGIGISLNLMNSMIAQSLIQVVIMSLLVLLIAVIIGIIIAKNITTPITNAINKLDDFSKGDFTVEFSSNKNDETKKLADALNKSIALLKQMLIGIKQDMDNLGSISNRLKASSQFVTNSSKNVSESIEEVAQGTEEQSSNICQVTEVFENFSKSLNSVQEKVENTAKSSTAIVNIADIGAEKLEGLINSIEEVRNSFNRTVTSIQQLNRDANKIGEIMNVINDVAQQTNLLALNAAIEAARAGEAGRGFSIVAEEIRKLAEKVMDSSKSTSEIITDILSGIEEVSGTTENISVKMAKQKDITDNTLAVFKNIQSEAHKTVPQYKNISEYLKGIVSEEKLILKSVEEVSAISDRIATSTQQISASIQEHTSTMEELSNIADKIDEMAIRLNENIGRFKV